ncbi:MAG: DNA mismatch repair protein MutS [Rikenellaceae bacterium]|nr:DNA mismatch repair protein MutS [Rikenellaceae bacterium]
MKNLQPFYRQILDRNEAGIRRMGRQMNAMGLVRLLLVAGWITTLVLFRNHSMSLLFWISGLFALPFATLMVFHDRLSRRRKYLQTWSGLCRRELKGLQLDYSGFDGAGDRIDSDHAFGFDLDLFGEHSLFQSFNRTVTAGGRERLIGWMTEPLREKSAIVERQQAVQELAAEPEFRHHFFVRGALDRGSAEDKQTLDTLTGQSFPFACSGFWKAAVWVVPGLWVLLGIGVWAGRIPGGILGLYFIVSTLLAYLKTRSINALHHSVNRMEKHLSVYSQLIALVEEHPFKAGLLKNTAAKFDSGTQKISASAAVKRLSELINALDQRANLFGILINIFLLRDIRTAIRLERWKQRYQAEIQQWLEALADLDALCSLGTFAFNHPEYPYPTISEDYFTLEGKALGHPLMRADVCVKNDVSFRSAPAFMVVTGANMAGKSTYLRTVAVNYLLACVGMPVCARELTVYPGQLVTSLRTSDSLVRNESYFFAELKRLKTIIDRLKSGQKLFIILDEILKGTNSADKQKGSMALIRQFLIYGTCGIIATHDLVLGSLAESFPVRYAITGLKGKSGEMNSRFPTGCNRGSPKT